jgi:hypothetical protein
LLELDIHVSPSFLSSTRLFRTKSPLTNPDFLRSRGRKAHSVPLIHFSQLVATNTYIMEIPHRGSRPALVLPEIYVQHDSNPSDRFRNSSRSSSYNSASSPSTASGPMSIPNSRDPVPPPLPPPRHLADIADGGNNGPDIAWQWGNSHSGGGWGESISSMSSVAPGSSLYGGGFAGKKSIMDDRPEYTRRTSSTSTVKSINGLERQENAYPRIDEGYASLSGTSIGSNRSVLPSQSSWRNPESAAMAVHSGRMAF